MTTDKTEASSSTESQHAVGSQVDRGGGRLAPKRNSRWRNTKTGKTARVMSTEPVEGYVVARYKGSMPWLLHVNDWHTTFEEAK